MLKQLLNFTRFAKRFVECIRHNLRRCLHDTIQFLFQIEFQIESAKKERSNSSCQANASFLDCSVCADVEATFEFYKVCKEIRRMH